MTNTVHDQAYEYITYSISWGEKGSVNAYLWNFEAVIHLNNWNWIRVITLYIIPVKKDKYIWLKEWYLISINKPTQ